MTGRSEMSAICPDCKAGRLYDTKPEDGYNELSCCVCGYYRNDSKGYNELSRRLFEEYFPKKVGHEPTPNTKKHEPENDQDRLSSCINTVSSIMLTMSVGT